MNNNKSIPIARPVIGKEEKLAAISVLESGFIAQGKKVEELEKKFASYTGTKHAIALNSGTAALHTSLFSAGISKGDEVITTPFTFIATANSILMQGAKPVFADIDENTFNLDPDSVIGKITKKTKAIIAVHLFGHLADITALKQIADDYHLVLIEDACQAHGAEYKGKKAGSFGDIAAFSLYATKNMTCGEGGLITTNNEKYANLAKTFRHHGQIGNNYNYSIFGYNYRMTDIQAAIAIEQLKKLDIFNAKRIKNASLLTKGLSLFDWIKTPTVKPGYKHVFHQYTITVEPEIRNKLLTYLNNNGVMASVFYPMSLHLTKLFMHYAKKPLPVSELISKKVLSLPVHPLVDEKDIKRIIDLIGEFNA